MQPASLRLRAALAALVSGVVLACGAPAEEPSALPIEPLPALSPRGLEAYERLRTAVRFTDDAIYDGGVTPNEVIAWRRLFEEPGAGPAFRRLEREASLPGRLFALCALYYLDPAAFQTRLPAWRAESGTVLFQTGCARLPDYPVRELVTSSRPRPVRLRPGETNRAWMEREGGGGAYDVEGGGWPNLFRDGGGWRGVSAEEYALERGP